MISSPTAYAESVDKVMIYIVGVSVLLLVGIAIAMIYFVIRYNRKRHPKAAQIEGNVALEIVWIVIPTIIVMSMFWYGYTDYKKLRETTKHSLLVKVTGQMWKWSFEYPDGRKTDTLYIPVDKTTRLEMRSVDVNHSFYIPAFRLKEDVIASKNSYLILEPIKIGSYDIACAEYCGLNHAYMYSKVNVLSEEDFEEWQNQGKPQTTDSTKSVPVAQASDSASTQGMR
jgi:cytochrome c oxidase subunit 2